MTNEERETLILERENLRIKLNTSDWPSPIDMRRVDEITSLLFTDGATKSLQIKKGKARKSNRVTSFTRDRR